jgi:hypothetical protein
MTERAINVTVANAVNSRQLDSGIEAAQRDERVT